MHAYPMNAPPLTPSGCVRGRAGLEEEEDPTLSEDLLGLWFFILPPPCKPRPPWSIKGGAGHPAKREKNKHKTQFDTDTTHHTQPSSNQALGIDSIRDLGSVPLSTVCTPYYEPLLVLITRATID